MPAKRNRCRLFIRVLRVQLLFLSTAHKQEAEHRDAPFLARYTMLREPCLPWPLIRPPRNPPKMMADHRHVVATRTAPAEGAEHHLFVSQSLGGAANMVNWKQWTTLPLALGAV